MTVEQATGLERLRALWQAGLALSSELSLDAVLRKIVETAAEITGARYAALGVIDQTRTQLERFIFTGIEPELAEEIGELPRGRGILGALIREARPLRLHDLGEDPRSVGLPAGHPPMKTFLGVPILLRGAAYGNLYLTEKEGGDFTDEDEELVTQLAAQAAVAIENARLYESATRWLRQLESLNEIGVALVAELELPRVLDLIATRVRELIGARLVLISLPTASGDLRVEAAAGDVAEAMLGRVLTRAGSKAGRVFERAHAERVDSMIDDLEVDQELARSAALKSGLFVPLRTRTGAVGVIQTHDRDGADPRFSEADQRLLEMFAERAAVAVELSQRVAREALQRVVEGQELERQRLARELHDETGQALTSILLGLRGVEEEAQGQPRLLERLAEVREVAVATLQDVRRLAVELRPKALDDFGLLPALERLAESVGEQTGIAVELEGRLGDRLPAETETALYRIVQEALTNVVKHAQARRVSVVLTRKDDSVAALVEDDGRGFSPDGVEEGRLGLTGIRERLSLLGGRLTLESAPDAGTTLVAEIPLPRV